MRQPLTKQLLRRLNSLMINMLDVTITTHTDQPTEADRRYRVLVLLQRSDRPRYYTFHCPQCTMPVCEIVNSDVVALSDLVDMETMDVGTGTRCNGRFNGGHCRTWYYFTLGEGR